ncbi:PglL family O-oligosaccharyltransferase [Acinetobacter bereziniae]|uniref:PglL family O-oligosaccharyltransferase n=1 Tax=Acinetobacter bereziniae TaxID=106648 RepID=UPI0018DE583A|nr:O-antigen ligase family protein [Acinetobacter bereziniae]MBI0395757.1 O-antigen ligase C-terminal domain-containing protein [Acinetobacter bereziniae]
MKKLVLLTIIIISFNLSWLLGDHFAPWLTFGSEIAAFFSIFFLLCLQFNGNLKVPFQLIPLFIISLIPLLQFIFGQIFFFSTALLSFLYLISFVFTVIYTFNLCITDFNRQKVMLFTSSAFIVAGLMTACMAIIQWLDFESFFPFVLELTAGRPFANFAQPNNMATALFLALLGCLYLFEKQKLPSLIVMMIALIILFAMVLSQSRTVWLGIIFCVVYWLIRNHKIGFRFNRFYAIGFTVIFVVFVLSLPLLSQVVGTSASTVMERATTGYLRLPMWTHTLISIQDNPWLGYGWNQSSFSYLDALPKHDTPERYLSSHNIILDMLVWNGIILGSLIVGYAIYWYARFYQLANSIESIIALMMITVVLIHAMLEFPLYYAFFLLPVAILCGIIQSEEGYGQYFKLSKAINNSIALIWLSFVLLVWRDYNASITESFEAKLYEMMRLFKEKPQFDKVTPYYAQNKIFLLDQLKYDAEWIALNPFSKLEEDQIEIYRNLTLLTPSKYYLYKYAQLAAYNGKQEDAEYCLFLIKRIYKSDINPDDLLKYNFYKDHHVSTDLKEHDL